MDTGHSIWQAESGQLFSEVVGNSFAVLEEIPAVFMEISIMYMDLLKSSENPLLSERVQTVLVRGDWLPRCWQKTGTSRSTRQCTLIAKLNCGKKGGTNIYPRGGQTRSPYLLGSVLMPG